jgi:hypothetical protein
MDVRSVLIPDELPAVRSLFREYAAGLGIDLVFQRFDEELAQLPGRYASPTGTTASSRTSHQRAGGARYLDCDRGRGAGRLHCVRPEFRGRGVGRLLAKSGPRGCCQSALPAGLPGMSG